jgi:hypothetical protein
MRLTPARTRRFAHRKSRAITEIQTPLPPPAEPWIAEPCRLVVRRVRRDDGRVPPGVLSLSVAWRVAVASRGVARSTAYPVRATRCDRHVGPWHGTTGVRIGASSHRERLPSSNGRGSILQARTVPVGLSHKIQPNHAPELPIHSNAYRGRNCPDVSRQNAETGSSGSAVQKQSAANGERCR